MTRSLIAILGLLTALTGCGQKAESPTISIPPEAPRIVDAGCGRCLFGRKEDKKCNLAIKVDGKSYFVDGFHIKQFGNPDLDGGMCKRVHKAKVAGEVANSRFVASAFELAVAPAN